jgi:hypothetical protein
MATATPYEEAIVSEQCQQLASQLGFRAYPDNDSAKPFMRYVSYSCKNRNSLLPFYALFTRIIDHFDGKPDPSGAKKTLKAYIESQHILESEPYYKHAKNTKDRKDEVVEAVFLCLGLWMMMKTNFVTPTGRVSCPIGLAYSVKTGRSDAISQEDLDASLHELIKDSGLIPPSNGEPEQGFKVLADALKASPDPNLQFPADVESLRIFAHGLNLSKLFTLAGVQVHWTDNLSRHLLLSVRANIWSVEIFAFPCVLLEDGYKRKIETAGISPHYLQEIRLSYANLFNPTVPSMLHRMFNWILKPICWCLYCSSYRLRRQELVKLNNREAGTFYDRVVENLSLELAQQWNHSSFPHLWPRILLLQMHLQNAKPWNFWVLFRDRRDKLPFWTFL